MAPALMFALLLGCWDEERLEIPGRSLSLQCGEECSTWSVAHAERLAGRKLWAVQVFAGSRAGAERALRAAEGRVPLGAYWRQGHPGRAQQGGVEQEGPLFRAVAAVYATREEAVRAARPVAGAFVR